MHEGHDIEVDVPSHELWYEADEGQIKQIVWNLATNGLRAMPDGGRLGWPARSSRRDGVVLTVQDEGIGIPAEELDGLFQPFHGTLCQRQRPRAGDRPSHRHRLQRRDSGQLAPGQRHHRRRAPAGARGGDAS